MPLPKNPEQLLEEAERLIKDAMHGLHADGRDVDVSALQEALSYIDSVITGE